ADRQDSLTKSPYRQIPSRAVPSHEGTAISMHRFCARDCGSSLRELARELTPTVVSKTFMDVSGVRWIREMGRLPARRGALLCRMQTLVDTDRAIAFARSAGRQL